MNNNIFEGAKFGDRFVTRDGRVALYIEPIYRAFTYHRLITKLKDSTFDLEYTIEGKVINSCEANDIVSRYQEPIDEKKLDDIAYDECMKIKSSGYIDDDIYILERGFKAGYKKAK